MLKLCVSSQSLSGPFQSTVEDNHCFNVHERYHLGAVHCREPDGCFTLAVDLDVDMGVVIVFSSPSFSFFPKQSYTIQISPWSGT